MGLPEMGELDPADRGALRLLGDRGHVHAFRRGVGARAGGPEPDQAVDVRGDEADVARAAIRRIELAHLRKTHVVVDPV